MQDDFSIYETGLCQLTRRIQQSHSHYSDVLVYQQRLTENINRSRRYGDTDTNRAERSEIIERLNGLALSILGITFNELCKEPRHNLPQPDYAQFVGRDCELKELRRLLKPYPHSIHSVIIIAGIGGVGKSALALEMAHRYWREYHQLPEDERFDVIIWFSAKETVLTANGLRPRPGALRTLNDLYTTISVTLDRQDITRARSEVQQDAMVRRILQQQRALLILDNLETVDDERLMAFLREPPAPTKVIVTTRHWVEVAYPVRLMGMPRDDGLNLIAQECKKRSISLSGDETEHLYRLTGGVPLVIVWNLAQIGFGYSIKSVLQRLGQPGSDIARYCFEGSAALIRDTNAHRLLMVLALFATDASREAIGYVAGLEDDELGRDEALVQLERLSLVNKLGNRFAMLPLTRTFAQGHLNNHPNLKSEATVRWVEYYLSLAERLSARGQQYAEFGVEAKNFYEVVDWCYANRQGEKFALLVLRLRTLMWAHGYWAELTHYLTQVRQYAQAQGNELMEARAEHATGWLSLFAGENEEAQKHLEKADGLFKRQGDLNGSLSTIGYLAQVHINVARGTEGTERAQILATARRLTERALETAYDKDGLTGQVQAFRERLITRLHRIRAEAAIEQEDYELAESDLDKAAAYRENRGERSGGLGVVYRLRGQLELQRGNLDQAEEWAQKSLDIAEEEGVQLDIARTEELLAHVVLRQGNAPRARQYAVETLDIYERLGLTKDAARVTTLPCGPFDI